MPITDGTAALRLRHLRYLAEHLARSGKVDPAVRHQFAQRAQNEMGAVDVGIESRKFVVERV